MVIPQLQHNKLHTVLCLPHGVAPPFPNLPLSLSLSILATEDPSKPRLWVLIDILLFSEPCSASSNPNLTALLGS